MWSPSARALGASVSAVSGYVGGYVNGRCVPCTVSWAPPGVCGVGGRTRPGAQALSAPGDAILGHPVPVPPPRPELSGHWPLWAVASGPAQQL